MEIARRAKVGTPAVYRRWKSKEALATTIVTSGLETEVRDTGDLRRDLIRWLRGRAEATHDDAYVHLLLTIAGIASRDPDTAALLRRAFESSREPLAARLEAAVARGELPPDVDTSLVQDLLQGAMHLPRIYSQQRRTEPDLERIADAVLRAVGPAPKATS